MKFKCVEPPSGTSFAQAVCPKGHPQGVLISKDDPPGKNTLTCPECAIQYEVMMPRVVKQNWHVPILEADEGKSVT